MNVYCNVFFTSGVVHDGLPSSNTTESPLSDESVMEVEIPDQDSHMTCSEQTANVLPIANMKLTSESSTCSG